jgi:hypothetical protein
MRKISSSEYDVAESVCALASTARIKPVLKGSGKEGASYLWVRHLPASEEAKKLALDLAKEIQTHKANRTKKPSAALIDAVGAVIRDMLELASRDPFGEAYRPMDANTFTDGPVKYDVFRDAIEDMERSGYIEVQRPCPMTPLPGDDKGVATIFKPLMPLVDLAEAYGIASSNIDEHFKIRPRPKAIRNAVVLKAEAEREFKKGCFPKKLPPVKMPFDKTLPEVAKHICKVNEINAFIAGQDILPNKHWAFQRVFNRGDVSGSNWNQGGRLISQGDSYQQMPGVTRIEERAGEIVVTLGREVITLNGEPTTEIDIRCSHLTIWHALENKPFSTDPDPRDNPGFNIAGVKRWLVVNMGKSKFGDEWPHDAATDYARKHGRDLENDHPFAPLKAAILKAIPGLNDWEKSKIKWGRLQFVESEVIVEAVHELAMVHGVAALPVHDSLIVPVSKKELAMKVLSATFKRHVGVEPYLTEK